eukprot:11164108-Alexandrium_andersonii.AAC.1
MVASDKPQPKPLRRRSKKRARLLAFCPQIEVLIDPDVGLSKAFQHERYGPSSRPVLLGVATLSGAPRLGPPVDI